MANLQLSMTMATRPCIITIYPRRIRGDILLPTETRKAVFHCWFSEQTVAAPSALRGGHPGGRVSCLLGLVEYEDGTMHLHDPREIRFIDSEEHFDSITWDEAEDDEGAETCATSTETRRTTGQKISRSTPARRSV